MSLLKKISLPFVGILLVTALVWQGRVVSKANGVAKAAETPAAAAAKVIKAEGRVAAYPGSEVTVSTDVAGTVVRLLVREQDQVRQGQVIAALRADDARAELNEAQARVNEAEADLRLFDTEVNRAESLYLARVGTRQSVDRAQRDRDGARARLETARSAVRRLEAVLAKSRILAPISGTVIVRQVDEGEAVNERQPLLTIADLRRVRVEAEVDEFDAANLALGAKADVIAEGYGEQWKATVEEIPDAVSPRRLKPEDPGRPVDTRVLLAKLAFEKPTPLKLGQRVEVVIQAAR